MRISGTLSRLYLPEDLRTGAEIDLPQTQAHFLGTVLRLKPGAEVRVFNGADGEWLAKLTQIAKRSAVIEISAKLREALPVPDIWLLFAPVKKARTDFIVEKATELGASAIQPVITRRTTSPHIKIDRMRAHVIEAAEQTERLDIPAVNEPIKLPDLLTAWDSERALIFADEAGDAVPAITALKTIAAPAAILIGPEGGFDPEERALLRAQSFVTPISLGPRILRADTAVAATLALWQAVGGDWDPK
jgi:16S rRNA (uracil1498-N3)-methyltransferase